MKKTYRTTLWTIGAVALMACWAARPAMALKVTWTSNDVTRIVFQDDYEEYLGAGFEGNRNPVADVGTFSTTSATNTMVLQEEYQAGQTYLPVGGSFEGNEYLMISRIPSGSGSRSATFSKGVVTNGSLRAEWMMYIPRTNEWNAITSSGLITLPVIAWLKGSVAGYGHHATWLSASPRLADNTLTNVLVHHDGSWKTVYRKGTTEGVPWQPNRWQKWTMDLVLGTNGNNHIWSVSVDGVESETMTAVNGLPVGWLGFIPNWSEGTCVFHIDAVTTDLPLLLHYDFVEEGSGPWGTATDKAGPYGYTHSSPIGGGNLNLVAFEGGYGLGVYSNVNRALDLGQGSEKEFDIDYDRGLLVETTVQFTNHNLMGTIIGKVGSSFSDGGWAISYFGSNPNGSLSNRFNIGISREGYPSGVNRQTTKFVSDAEADHVWRIQAEWRPYNRGAILRFKLHDMTANTIYNYNFTDSWIESQTNIMRTLAPMRIGVSGVGGTPFPGIIGPVKVYGWGEPERIPPPMGSVIMLR